MHLPDSYKSSGIGTIQPPSWLMFIFVGLAAWCFSFAFPSNIIALGIRSAALSVIICCSILALYGGAQSLLRSKILKKMLRQMNNTGLAAAISDPNGHVIFANPLFWEIFNTSNSKNIAKLLRKADRDISEHVRLFMNNPNESFMKRVFMDGQSFELTANLDTDEHFLWTVRKREHSNQYESKTPVVILDRDNHILSTNCKFIADAADNGKTFNNLFPNGKIRWGSVNLLSDGEAQEFYLVLRHRKDDHQSEVYLLPPDAYKDKARAIDMEFDALLVPMLKVSVDGLILKANAHAERLLPVANFEGLMLQNLLEGLGRPISDWLLDAQRGRGLNHPNFLQLKRSEQEKYVQVSLSRSFEGGQPVLIAVLSDATELKTHEAQFVQSQKMQAIGQLAGGIAHDFNNLLTAISGHCDLLLLRHDQADQDFADLSQINQNANRAAALVAQLLAFSRKQTLRLESLDVRNTLGDLTHLLNRLVGERITLNLQHSPENIYVRADKRQLEQVLMNLVVNARDAMPEGGEIVVKTERLFVREAFRRDRATVDEGEYVSITVKDQGCGIPKESFQKIFEPFYTTKRTGEGTGLGLSTVYGIVKQSGGFIFVESGIGEGTQFTLLMPFSTSEPIAAPKARTQNTAVRPMRKGSVILLVEDETTVRTFASRALKLRGFDVIEAASGEEALEILEGNQRKIDLFVSDVVMPGMDGPTWVKKARVLHPKVNVIFVSGYAEDSFDVEQAKIEHSSFLPKPFSLKQLIAAVDDQLNHLDPSEEGAMVHAVQ